MRKMNKTRRYKGGGLGQGYTLGAPIIPGVDTGINFTPQSSCMDAARPGMISPPTTGLGLPGMSGGRRGSKRRGSKRRGSKRRGSKRRGSKRRGSKRKGTKRRGTKRRRQRGGRYSFDLGTSATFGGTPWGSGIPQVVSIPCEAARGNPLNLQRGGVGGVDSAFYSAPTAGYTNTPSTWVGSTGAPSLLQTPYDARVLNPACMKTGGGRRKTSKRRK